MSLETKKILQYKIIIEKSKELLKVVFENDVAYLQNMINSYQVKIDHYNKKNLTIIDASSRENGLWNAMIKTIVKGKYYNPIIKNRKSPPDRRRF